MGKDAASIACASAEGASALTSATQAMESAACAAVTPGSRPMRSDASR